MTPAHEQAQPPNASRAPRSGLIWMVIIVAALVLIAIYANVQKARRAVLEEVTIIPVSSPTPSP